MTTIAWHYTIGLHATGILRDGVIRGATEGVPLHERPVVWFSTRQSWEPTATKGMIDRLSGRRRDATMEEMFAHGGLWRFGVPASELLPWRKLREAAGITSETANGLLRAAKRAGADPFFWYGSLEPVAVTRCTVQCRLTDSSEWSLPR